MDQETKASRLSLNNFNIVSLSACLTWRYPTALRLTVFLTLFFHSTPAQPRPTLPNRFQINAPKKNQLDPDQINKVPFKRIIDLQASYLSA